MELFVNDKRVRVFGPNKELDLNRYDYVLKTVKGSSVNFFKGKVLIVNASPEMLIHFIDFIEDHKLKKLRQIDFSVINPDKVEILIKNHFKIVKAAGGIVRKSNDILLIYRLKKWDLPKGKLDKGETIAQCAVREVEEETGVKVEIDSFFKKSYHTYIRKKKRVLKETHWYLMRCIEDIHMAPQANEGIEDVKWKSEFDVAFATQDTYKSLKRLLKKYYRS